MARVVRIALVWIWAAAAVAALGGCQTLRTGLPQFGAVGPDIDAAPGGGSPASHEKVRLDVVVPVFDPGLPEDEDDYEKQGVWPELRRAEANRFAVLLKKELDATGMFGDVHVSPDANAIGDLYVMGAIREANGEDVEIEIAVRDIGGSSWLRESYKHRVKEAYFRNARNAGRDSYRPVFRKAAADIAMQVKARSNEDLASLRNLTEVRFAGVFAPDSFDDHVERQGNRTKLKSLPAQNDPMFQRTRAIRVQDGMFMARMGEEYQSFYDDTRKSYLIYQKAALSAAKERRKKRQEAVAKGVFGGVAILGAIMLGQDAHADETLQQAAAVSAAAVGAGFLASAVSSAREAKYHEETLAQLGDSVDLSMSPKVIEVESRTVTLTGDARKQFREWRTFLKEVHDLEKVPEKKL